MTGRPITSDDLLALPVLNDPQISPDGRQVAFTVTRADRDANAYRTHLWLVPSGGGDARQLTAAPARDTGPRWSPDGTQIAFVSDRGGEKQVWVIRVDGGEARALTSGKRSPADLAWSPDGRWLAFVGKPDAAGRDESDVRVISRLRYKQDGEGFWDGRWKHVFVVPASGGDISQVTQGDFDHLTPAWSPDGASLAYTANPDPDADLTNVSDIWVVPVGGAAPPRRLSRGIGPAQSPAWSPDGTTIAYIGHDNACWGATNWRVWAVRTGGADPVCLTQGDDRSVGHHLLTDLRAHPSGGGLSWSPDAQRVFFMIADGGSTQIASVAASGGPIRVETRGDHELIGCSLDRAGRTVACVESDALSPGEAAVTVVGAGPSHLRRLTDLAGPPLHSLALSRPERFQFESLDGFVVKGWVMRPVSAAMGTPCPAVLKIHGGPHAAYGNAFFHEFQLLAAEGYGVIYLNPRGSQGYGQAFTAATRHDWGGKDYADLMRGLDHALAAHPWIDSTRLAVSGGSYGGFMTNWVVGHTRRFRAAVTDRSISNAYSQWGTSDLAYMKGFWEYPGEPWECPQFYLERSPITYVREIRTPLLIIHSENDFRCPMEQAEQLFVALRKQGTPTMLIRFPNESHDLSRSGQPRHRVERLRHMLTWFRTYLAPRAEDASSSQHPAREQVAADDGDG
jgi:dipeptidyl aminopeptidase/acylaminoacyl peptidase